MRAMSDILIGIDIGSTNIKTAAFDKKGNLVVSYSKPMTYQPNGIDEVLADPEYIWDSVAGMLKQIAQQAAGNHNILAVSVTGMGNDGIPVTESGEILYPMISWKSKCTTAALEELKETIGLDTYFEITGIQARTVDTILRLIWFKHEQSERFNRIFKWLLIEDYINYKLCNETCTDATLACTTGLYDIEKNEWSDVLLSAFGIKKSIMPVVRQSGEIIGKITKKVSSLTGIPLGTPVVLGGWDIQCAAFALGGARGTQVINTLGTWETLMLESDKLLKGKKLFENGLHCCKHVIPGKYTYSVFVPSSSIVEWHIRNFYPQHYNSATSDAVYDAFVKDISLSTYGANGMMFLPHIFGGYFPKHDANSLGAFIGISAHSQRSDYTRSLLEGMSYASKQILEVYSELIHEGPDEMILSGGGTKNTEWMQIKADIYQKNIKISTMVEATALGAALLAGVGIGLYRGFDDARDCISTSAHEVKPSPDAVTIYDRYYQIAKQLYPLLKPTSYELKDLADQVKINGLS